MELDHWRIDVGLGDSGKEIPEHAAAFTSFLYSNKSAVIMFDRAALERGDVFKVQDAESVLHPTELERVVIHELAHVAVQRLENAAEEAVHDIIERVDWDDNHKHKEQSLVQDRLEQPKEELVDYIARCVQRAYDARRTARD